MTTSVRPATLDDVDFIVHVIFRTFASETDKPDDEWAARERDSATEQVLGKVPDSVLYVIMSGDERVGRLRVVRTSEHLHLAGIQILPAHRGRGAGSSVITTLLEEAAERQLPTVLQVAKTNPDAERLYTRLGFRRTGEEGDDYWMSAG